MAAPIRRRHSHHGSVNRGDGILRPLTADPDSHQQLQRCHHRRASGLWFTGVARRFQRAWDTAIAVEQRQDRHRSATDRAAAGNFYFMAAGAY